MRKIDLPKVTINGEEYPIYCDLYVMQQIQERMDLNDFERGIIGAKIVRDENGEPVRNEKGLIELIFDKYDINALILGLSLMINEGLLIDSEQEDKEYDSVNEKYIGRVCDIPLPELSEIVLNAFRRCLKAKKNTAKKTSKRKNTTTR